MKSNHGFSLVELMVAMVIGLIIVLGAGQLFLTVFQTNRQVEILSQKQAAVNFSVEVLLRDIRRAESISEPENDAPLRLVVPNRGDVSSVCSFVEKVYRIGEDEVSPQEGWALEVAQSCSGPVDVDTADFQEVAVAFTSSGFSVAPAPGAIDGVWVVTLELMPIDIDGSPDSLVFYSVNRTQAVTSDGS